MFNLFRCKKEMDYAPRLPMGVRTLARKFPKSFFMNAIRCFYYNNFEKLNFEISFNRKGYFEIYMDNNIFLKFYDDPFDDFICSISGYIKKYKIKDGDYIIDVGAYVGSFTIYAAKIIGNSGKIIAFEPDKPNFDKLAYNIKLNNLDNVIVINKGLWNENKELEFDSQNNAGSSVVLSKDNIKGKVMYYKFVKLDDELKKLNINKVDFIKMDIEGAEIEAIEGCKNILKNNNVNLAIASYHIRNGEKTYKKLEHILNNLGYKTKTEFPKHLTTYARKY